MNTRNLSEMSFETAIKILAGKIDDNDDYRFATQGTGSASSHYGTALTDSKQAAQFVVAGNVAHLCETDTDGLGDWLGNGFYSGNETAQSLATERDELNV